MNFEYNEFDKILSIFIKKVRVYFGTLLENEFKEEWPNIFRECLYDNQKILWDESINEEHMQPMDLIDFGYFGLFSRKFKYLLEPIFKKRVHDLSAWFNDIKKVRNLKRHENEKYTTEQNFYVASIRMIEISKKLNIDEVEEKLNKFWLEHKKSNVEVNPSEKENLGLTEKKPEKVLNEVVIDEDEEIQKTLAAIKKIILQDDSKEISEHQKEEEIKLSESDKEVDKKILKENLSQELSDSNEPKKNDPKPISTSENVSKEKNIFYSDFYYRIKNAFESEEKIETEDERISDIYKKIRPITMSIREDFFMISDDLKPWVYFDNNNIVLNAEINSVTINLENQTICKRKLFRFSKKINYQKLFDQYFLGNLNSDNTELVFWLTDLNFEFNPRKESVFLLDIKNGNKEQNLFLYSLPSPIHYRKDKCLIFYLLSCYLLSYFSKVDVTKIINEPELRGCSRSNRFSKHFSYKKFGHLIK